MDKLRLLYEQTGRSIWCSHLDTMRTWQRAMNRAGVPIKYSEGFNPHAQISILMPLSVGTESLCQLVDIRVREDVDMATLPEKINAVLPEGLRVLSCYEEGGKPAEVKWLSIEGFWEYDTADPQETAEALAGFFAQPVEVLRKTKRGEGMFPITEHMKDFTFTPEDGGVRVRGTISCSEPVVNPDLIAAAVRQNRPELMPDGGHFCRIGLFRPDGTIFR